MQAMPADIVYLVLIVLGIWCCRKTFTSPNPSPKDEEQKKYDSSDTMLLPVKTLADMLKTLYYLLNAVELAAALEAILRLEYLPGFLRSPGTLYIMSLERLIGLAFIVSGTALRIVCYRRMQKNFTFQLALRDDHKLVTDGPYSYVRHPSYTGACVVIVACPLYSLGRGSWWAGYALPSRSPWILVGVCQVILAAITLYGTISRCEVEDDVLKRHFKDEWIRWSKKTPYRLVPWVY